MIINLFIKLDMPDHTTPINRKISRLEIAHQSTDIDTLLKSSLF